MRASHASQRTPARTAWLSLAAAALALTVWGITTFAAPQPVTDLAQHSNAGLQLADGGGTRPGG